MSLTRAVLTSLLLAIAPTQNRAQSIVGAGAAPAVQPTNTPTIHVYSRETIVDVLVTDDKGQPLRGLTRSDFTIEEDGHPQPIRGFSEYDQTTPPQPPRTLPPNTYTNDNALPATGPVQIFVFDLLVTPPDTMERAKKYIADYLRTMPEGTQAAIFELSPTKELVLLQDFTTNGKAAAAVVDNLNVEWIRPPVIVATPIAIAGMNRIADYVAAIHGRKNLIWVLAGMPLAITRDGMNACPAGAPDLTYVHRLMDLYDVFTREQIAIDPVNAGGIHGLGCNSLTAELLAESTGGATDNTNDYKGEITKMVDQSSHGYTISYVPTRPDEDGHFHPIKITVNRPGLHLNYRPGYNDEQPQPPDKVLKQQMTQGPMRLGAIPATQLLFDLHIEPTAAQPALASASVQKTPHAKDAPYTTTFTFSPAQIALLQQPDGTRTASIELDLGAFDFYGQLVSARSQTFKLTVTPTQYESFYRKPIQFPLAIDLPPGKLTLRAGIFDTTGSKAGTLEIPFAVPKK